MAEQNLFTTGAGDIAPVISVDVATEFSGKINKLASLITAIGTPVPVPAGKTINIHQRMTAELVEQSAEGEEIGLSNITSEGMKKVDMVVQPNRSSASAQAVQTFGRDIAITQRDDALVNAKYIKMLSNFVATVENDATDGGSTKDIHGVSAKAQGHLASLSELTGNTGVVVLANPMDISALISGVNYQVQRVEGIDVLLMPTGAVIIPISKIQQGKAYATNPGNLNMYFVPVTSEVGEVFNLSSDKYGYLGLTHSVNTDTATIDTLLVGRVEIVPSFAKEVYKYTIAPGV